MNADILKKYNIKGNTKGKQNVAGFDVINFDTLTMAMADALYKAKCPLFEKKPKAVEINAKDK